ncbi:MAG: M1 family metallopeptidase, partial [Gammaproteobacteria bacterium]
MVVRAVNFLRAILCFVAAARFSRFCVLLVAALLTACDAPETIPVDPANEPTGIRLPDNVQPLRYRLDLTVDPTQEAFAGHVEIDVELQRATKRIWLHGDQLEVDAATVITESGDVIDAYYTQVDKDGLVRLDLKQQLEPQLLQLHFDYTGSYRDGLMGMYKSVVDGDAYVFTQFETVAARWAFPSFDEPRFKTPFETKLTIPADDKGFSNTPVLSETPLSESTKQLVFATTQPLPTYLVALAVGPLDVVNWDPVPPSKWRSGALPLRGIARRGQGTRLRYALANTATMVRSLEDYFGVSYPYAKLDLVAVPEFAWGGMENAGLITYRESLLLLDDEPSPEARRRFGTLHAHELAHQWFGNLVTMEWWDDVWLNEAFATWIAAHTAQEWAPEFNFADDIQQSGLRAMEHDNLSSARRIREPVNTTNDIENAFDVITYQKGAAVLGMLEAYVGSENFRNGIRRYIDTHAFGSATVYDLMTALDLSAGEGKDVSGVFNSFLTQTGVPFIEPRLDCEAEPRLQLRQKRFLPIGSIAETRRLWSVPVCVAYGAQSQRQEQCFLLSEPEQSWPIAAESCPGWLIPDVDGAGYYRWRLKQGDAIRLQAVVRERLSRRERIAFSDSLLAGLQRGALDMNAFLEVLPLFGSATERRVIEMPIPVYERLVHHIVDTDAREEARAYAAGIYMPLLAAVRNENFPASQEERQLT